jgi:FkbM family methyltransferase
MFEVTGSRFFKRLEKAHILVRRFGITQSLRLLLPELVRETRISRSISRLLGQRVEKLRMEDSTLFWLRPFSMDLGIFHEVWDHERYTAGQIGAVACGGTIVDIGAHIGLFSLFAARKLRAKRIVSVEPDYVNFELLSKNISTNRVRNASLVRAALAGESGVRRFFANSWNTGGHSLYSRTGSSQLVSTTSLADLFRTFGISECSLLKLDCEGAEMEILDSAPDELLRGVSAIALEYHLAAYPLERFERFKVRMENLGFNLETQPTSGVLGILRGIRRA